MILSDQLLQPVILFRLGLDIAQGAVDRVGLPDLEDVIVFPARGRIVGCDVLPVQAFVSG